MKAINEVLTPESLKMLALKTVVMDSNCIKTGCKEPPICFLMFENEYGFCCRKHFEISTFYHDGLDCFHTAPGCETRFTVYVGVETVYIYTYLDHSPIKQYTSFVSVIPSIRVGGGCKGDVVVIELKPGFYLLIADYLCVFKSLSEEKIERVYSYIDPKGVLNCCAIGNEMVYAFPHSDVTSHRFFEKRLYSNRIGTKHMFTDVDLDILLEEKPLNSTLVRYNNIT